MRFGIGASVHYTPLHLLSFYKKFLNNDEEFPVAERIYEQILSLPLFPTLTKKNINFIIETIKEALARTNKQAD